MKFLSSLALLQGVLSFDYYRDNIPNGHKLMVDGSAAAAGHLRLTGGGLRNAFGEDFAAADHMWTKALCEKDSDGDGLKNGLELGDPECTWSKGATPTFDTGITHPGIADESDEMRSVDTCADWNAPTNIDSAEISLTFPGYIVPTEHTTYAKFAFNTADLLKVANGGAAMLTADHTYGIRFSPILQNKDVVHHMLLYACDEKPDDSFINKPSTEAKMACTNLRYAWAVGAPDFCMPEGVGPEFPSARTAAWLVLEIHYDNPKGTAGIVDTSGVKITLAASKANVLTYQPAGFLWMGSQLPALTIPPQQETYHVSVDCSFPALPEAGVTAFAYITHAHKLGRKMYTKLYRGGKYLHDAGCDGNYDFDLQEFKPFQQPFKVYPKDKLQANCVYNSMERTEVTQGGDETLNEMCINFIIYYPVVDGNTQCLKQPVKQPASIAGLHTCCAGDSLTNNSRVCKELRAPTQPKWVLSHGLFMIVSWGILLPGGVAVSKFLRAALPTKWFAWHVRMQVAGIVFATIGLIIASVNLPGHFDSPHKILGLVVMLLGWQQPINGFLRAHTPKAGEAKSQARIYWEYLHKGSGGLAVLLGVVNVGLGLAVRQEYYGNAGVIPMYALLGVGLLVLIITIVVVQRKGAKIQLYDK